MRVCRLTHRVQNRNGVATNAQLLNSRQVFAMDTLHRLGVPETQENANALLAQFQAEQSRIDLPPAQNVANYNPGNIEVATAESHGDKGITGGWPIAPQIAMFDSFVDGVDAYANELRRIAPQAVADLKRQAPASQTVSDIGASGWGTNTVTMQSILAAGSERGAAERYPVSATSKGQNTLTPPPSSGGDSIIPNIPGLPSNPLDALGSGITGAVGSIESFGIRAGKVLLGVLLLAGIVLIMVKT